MNRRRFLASAAVIPPGIWSLSYREERKAFRIDHNIEAHMIVSAHHGNKSAEAYRREWVGRPFEGFGEWYLNSTEMRDLPTHLAQMPGNYSFHTATIGVAAEHREYLVGAFRREYICCIVRILGDHEAAMLTIAEHIASRQVPSLFEIIWSPIYLTEFIPDSDDFGMPVEESTVFWP